MRSQVGVAILVVRDLVFAAEAAISFAAHRRSCLELHSPFVQANSILHEQERLVRQELRTQSSGEVKAVEEHSASAWVQAWCSSRSACAPQV